MNFVKRLSSKGDKIYFYYDLGRNPGQRPATGIFIYTHPKNQSEKNHNKESLVLLEVKKSQLTLEQQSIGSGFIPSHKFKHNFIEYFQQYVDQNRRGGNRHLEGCFNHFKKFIKSDVITPMDITENLCKRFRQYLLDRFTGDTPSNYYLRFKWVLKAATKEGYYRVNPTEDITAKSNPSKKIKENLEADEYLKLLHTPCFNEEVKEGFLFSCYTGLRYVDVYPLRWNEISDNVLTTRILQKKTGKPVTLTLHPIAKAILDKRRMKKTNAFPGDKIFRLPTNDGCNKIIQQWVTNAGIQKQITWSCARLSFSILLQDKNVGDATVAYLMGHTTTDQVRSTYKRHRPKDQAKTISQLPMPDEMPYFLKL